MTSRIAEKCPDMPRRTAMRSVRRIGRALLRALALPALAVGMGVIAPATQADAQAEAPAALIVVYGALAQSREGDTDRREQIFFSVPANTAGRLYVRLFDPEVSGTHDYASGGTANARTTFRLFGGAGTFTGIEGPQMVADGDKAERRVAVVPATGPGRELAAKVYANARATNGRWVNLGAVRARQGEKLGERSYFRIEVEGTGGDDGNGFSVGVSLARDRARDPAGLEMFAYQTTVRWNRGTPPTEVRFSPDAPGPYRVQSFDAANGDLAIVTDFADLPVRASGQDFWTVDTLADVPLGERNLALGFSGGFETPNDVTVSVFDVNGAAVRLAMPPRRRPAPARPLATASGRPLADCRAVAFDASAASGRTPLDYLWEFGDGQRSDMPVIAHRYAEPGRYTARLRVVEQGARPGRGAQTEVPVHVRSAPVAQPGDAIVVAPGEALEFDGSGSVPSDSPITRYFWTFGDGQTATGPQTENIYEQPGSYRSVLRVEDDSAHPCHYGVATRQVTVNAPPVAEAGKDRQAIVGKAIRLSAAASYDIDGEIASYSWDMGDGSVVTGDTISYAYQQAGRFAVVLSVTDDSGVTNATAQDRMIVEVNAPPVPRIAIPPRAVSVSEEAILDASGSGDDDGEILLYLWDFGDGATGEGKIVNYAWTRPGIYTLTLSVTDDSGTATAEQSTQRQIVIDAAPVADAGADQFVTASEVVFDGGGSSDSDGAITRYEWDFGDGGTATGRQVRHAYLRPGVYEVALRVKDDSTAPLNVDRDTMILTVNAAPIADAGPPQTVAPDEEFLVSARASVDPDGAIVRHIWTFPDGSTTQRERASHRLSTPGLHRVGLTVHDNFRGGAATDRAEVLITVNAQPVAVAGPDLLIAPGDVAVMDAVQSYDTDGTITAYRWQFDDIREPVGEASTSRSWDRPGVYSAQLTVTDDSGVLNATATDDRTIRVNHPPVADAGPALVTDELHVRLSAAGSSDGDGDALIYKWDMGDGSPAKYGEQVDHSYPRAGVYPVALTVDDGTGLSNARAISSTVVTVQSRPLALAGGNRDVCSGEPILFDASGSNDPDGGALLYSWDFGDGSGSDLINPSKTYERPGVYPVTLRVRNETGTIWGSAVDRVAALVREGPIADAGPDMTVCTNQRVRFDGTGSTDADGAVNAFGWTFGDGGSASGDSPVHIFKRPGNFAVTLTITGEAVAACSPLDTDVVNVAVVAAPEQQIIAADRAAAGTAAEYAVEIDELGGAQIVSTRWEFSDGANARGAKVLHSFDTPGVYFATVRTELAGGNPGCSVIETRRKVIVNAAPVPAIAAPEMVAVGEAVVFDASASTDSDGALTGFAWNFGDGSSAEGVVVAHVFSKSGVFDVTLTATDDAGVANSDVTLVRRIKVNPAPIAGLLPPPPVCAGDEVPWQVGVPDTTDVAWVFAGQTRKSGAKAVHTFARPGLFPVTVMLDDGAGLPNSRRSEEIYVRVNAQPTALAGPDRAVCPGDPVIFDAGGSGDLDGSITNWTWEFSDGVSLSGARVERHFDTPGALNVRLTVADDSGAAGCGFAEDVAAILVNATPVVDAGPDITMPVGAAHDVASFDAAGARDADGQGLRFTWDFGDGGAATGAAVRHRYGSPGSYEVTVQAADTTGLACGIGSDTATVHALARQ